MRIRSLFIDNRLPNTMKFCIAVLSIISGMFLILMLFYQHVRLLYLIFQQRLNPQWTYTSEFQPELFHPEVFIPEIIILLLLGTILLYVLKWRVKNGIEDKYVDRISLWLTIWTFVFIMLFTIGFIIAHEFFGRYEILGPAFGILSAVVVICGSIYVIVYLYKSNSIEDRSHLRNDMSQKKLLDNRVLNYKLVTIIFLGLALISFFMTFVLAQIVPLTPCSASLEAEKVALPGMNVTFNLTVEVGDGPGTTQIVVIETSSSGNWSVSPSEIIVGPNERKSITFTNYVPQNATENIQYSYHFMVNEIGERGPNSEFGESIVTRVTDDIDEYYASQTTPDTTTIFSIPIVGFQQSIQEIMIDLAIIIFLTWVIISAFFIYNYNISNTRINI
ncbi:MAG: hypothetical protein JSV09_08045 [Thermoplasmata archaeon]|nr:MAG: hypothetical protein JSV09_08045 [Thermoplasmata archaeon]